MIVYQFVMSQFYELPFVTEQGTDVTEAFEAHHVSTAAVHMLKHFYVRQARTQRNSPYTFDEVTRTVLITTVSNAYFS